MFYISSNQHMPILATFAPNNGIKIKASAVNQDLGNSFSKHIVEQKDPRFVYAIARAVTADVPNKNGDLFPLDEIKKHYTSFIGRNIFLDHNTTSVRNAVGKIVAAELREDEEGHIYVACLFKVDRQIHPDIAMKIEDGIIDSVSMGANVGYCVCSVCKKQATRESEFCEHLQSLGRYYDPYTGQPNYSENHDIDFTELSLVSVPADPSAKMHKVFHQRTNINKTADDQSDQAVHPNGEQTGQAQPSLVTPNNEPVTAEAPESTATQPEANTGEYILPSNHSTGFYQIDCASNEKADLLYNIFESFTNKGIKEIAVTGKSIRILFEPSVTDYEKFLEDAVSVFGLMVSTGIVLPEKQALYEAAMTKTASADKHEFINPDFGTVNYYADNGATHWVFSFPKEVRFSDVKSYLSSVFGKYGIDFVRPPEDESSFVSKVSLNIKPIAMDQIRESLSSDGETYKTPTSFREGIAKILENQRKNDSGEYPDMKLTKFDGDGFNDAFMMSLAMLNESTSEAEKDKLLTDIKEAAGKYGDQAALIAFVNDNFTTMSDADKKLVAQAIKGTYKSELQKEQQITEETATPEQEEVVTQGENLVEKAEKPGAALNDRIKNLAKGTITQKKLDNLAKDFPGVAEYIKSNLDNGVSVNDLRLDLSNAGLEGVNFDNLKVLYSNAAKLQGKKELAFPEEKVGAGLSDADASTVNNANRVAVKYDDAGLAEQYNAGKQLGAPVSEIPAVDEDESSESVATDNLTEEEAKQEMDTIADRIKKSRIPELTKQLLESMQRLNTFIKEDKTLHQAVDTFIENEMPKVDSEITSDETIRQFFGWDQKNPANKEVGPMPTVPNPELRELNMQSAPKDPAPKIGEKPAEEVQAVTPETPNDAPKSAPEAQTPQTPSDVTKPAQPAAPAEPQATQTPAGKPQPQPEQQAQQPQTDKNIALDPNGMQTNELLKRIGDSIKKAVKDGTLRRDPRPTSADVANVIGEVFNSGIIPGFESLTPDEKKAYIKSISDKLLQVGNDVGFADYGPLILEAANYFADNGVIRPQGDKTDAGDAKPGKKGKGKGKGKGNGKEYDPHDDANYTPELTYGPFKVRWDDIVVGDKQIEQAENGFNKVLQYVLKAGYFTQDTGIPVTMHQTITSTDKDYGKGPYYLTINKDAHNQLTYEAKGDGLDLSGPVDKMEDIYKNVLKALYKKFSIDFSWSKTTSATGEFVDKATPSNPIMGEIYFTYTGKDGKRASGVAASYQISKEVVDNSDPTYQFTIEPNDDALSSLKRIIDIDAQDIKNFLSHDLEVELKSWADEAKELITTLKGDQK